MTRLEEARAFREAFNQECLNNFSNYGFMKKKLWDLQLRLISEESREFFEAADELAEQPENNVKRENVLKELCDLVFVCYQFAAAFGLDLDRAMTLVFESNMSKLDEQGKPIFRPDGKVLKGPNYQPPDLMACVPSVHLNHYDTNGK